MARTKHWRPDPIEDAFSILQKHTVDTGRYANPDPREVERQMEIDEHRMRCVAEPFYTPNVEYMKYGLKSVHVTDDPWQVTQVLSENQDLQMTRPYGDLCGGLYVSSCPDIWISRSRKKWEFLETLEHEKAKILAKAIMDDLHEKRQTRYLTESEYEAGLRMVGLYLELKHPPTLSIVAGQPYNVHVQDLARKTGVADPFRPILVNVWFQGRYVDMGSPDVWEAAETLARHRYTISEQMMQQEDVCRVLRAEGWDGCFTKASMSRNQELVIWNGEAIKIFGSYIRPGSERRPALGAREGGISFAGERFEVFLSNNRRTADVRRLRGNEFLTMLDQRDIEQLAQIAEAALSGQSVSSVGGKLIARGDVDRDGVDIVYPSTLKKWKSLDREDMADLSALSRELLGMIL